MTTNWLSRALEESRARGFIGPGPLEPHVEHSHGFEQAWLELRTGPPTTFLDLGSGGGLPALVLLAAWAGETEAVLVDSIGKRAEFLVEVLARADAPPGGRVVHGRIETLARNGDFDGRFPLVTARSFGPPAVVAECAARCLSVGGLLIVSEPPEEGPTARWDDRGLATLGLASRGRHRFGAAFHVVEKVSSTPATYPRAVGVPGKRPLF